MCDIWAYFAVESTPCLKLPLVGEQFDLDPERLFIIFFMLARRIGSVPT